MDSLARGGGSQSIQAQTKNCRVLWTTTTFFDEKGNRAYGNDVTANTYTGRYTLILFVRLFSSRLDSSYCIVITMPHRKYHANMQTLCLLNDWSLFLSLHAAVLSYVYRIVYYTWTTTTKKKKNRDTRALRTP